MKDEHLYLTSDIALAAYLLSHGYELLGAVDDGKVSRHGRAQMEWGITTTDPYKLADLEVHLHRLALEFERSPERNFYKMIKELHHALDAAIRR